MKKSFERLDTVSGRVNRYLRDHHRLNYDDFMKNYRQILVIPKEIEQIFYDNVREHSVDYWGNTCLYGHCYKGHKIEILQLPSKEIIFVFLEDEIWGRTKWSEEYSTKQEPFWYRNLTEIKKIESDNHRSWWYGMAKAWREQEVKMREKALIAKENAATERQTFRNAIFHGDWIAVYHVAHDMSEEYKLKFRAVVLWMAIHCQGMLTSYQIERAFSCYYLGRYGGKWPNKLSFEKSAYNNLKSRSIISKLFYQRLRDEIYQDKIRKQKEQQAKARERMFIKKQEQQFFASLSMMGINHA